VSQSTIEEGHDGQGKQAAPEDEEENIMQEYEEENIMQDTPEAALVAVQAYLLTT
jgi:hypothetical protein